MAGRLLGRAVSAVRLSRTALRTGCRLYTGTEPEPLTVRQQSDGIRCSSEMCPPCDRVCAEQVFPMWISDIWSEESRDRKFRNCFSSHLKVYRWIRLVLLWEKVKVWRLQSGNERQGTQLWVKYSPDSAATFCWFYTTCDWTCDKRGLSTASTSWDRITLK